MNIIGKMNMPVQVKKTAADEWWDGLEALELSDCPGKCIPGAFNGYVRETSPKIQVNAKACFNEGLRCDKGFEEWWESLPEHSGFYRSQARIVGGELRSLSDAIDFWQSIHEFKAKQAERKV